MTKRHTRTSGVLMIAVSAMVSAPFFVSAAESPIVVETRDSNTVTYQVPIEEPDPRAQGTMEDQYQLQLLQQEVMQLRGTVEELQYQLNQLKSIADDRYLELDGRLQQALTVKPAAPAVAEPTEDVADPITDETASLSEQELYDTAQQLIRNRQYDMAIAQLESMIERFPNGTFTANGYYWLGQVYAAKSNPDFEKARQALAQVISFFPDHGKVPDAAFALGRVYHTLGDCERARELLTQVTNNYAGSSAALLADNFLAEIGTCES